MLGKPQRQTRPGPEIAKVALIRAARVVGGPGVEDLANAFLNFGIEDGNLAGCGSDDLGHVFAPGMRPITDG